MLIHVGVGAGINNNNQKKEIPFMKITVCNCICLTSFSGVHGRRLCSCRIARSPLRPLGLFMQR